MRTSHKILYAKDRTLHLILTDYHPIQIDDQSPTTSHWSAHNESCQLENLEKTRSVFSDVTTQFYLIGHDTYFKQMLTSTETSLRTAKQQDITYVRAAPRRTPLQLSLLLNEGLVFGPASLDLAALHPSTLQKTIEQKTQQMQWRMFLTPDDDRWTETAQTLSNF